MGMSTICFPCESLWFREPTYAPNDIAVPASKILMAVEILRKTGCHSLLIHQKVKKNNAQFHRCRSWLWTLKLSYHAIYSSLWPTPTLQLNYNGLQQLCRHLQTTHSSLFSQVNQLMKRIPENQSCHLRLMVPFTGEIKPSENQTFRT